MQTLKLRKVKDIEINEFLNSRNMPFNKDKMVNKNKIKSVNHYTWWFSNKRDIYCYEIDKSHKIFFCYKVCSSKKIKFIVGGWHSNQKKTNLIHILYFQKWQITNKKKLGLSWIAVVKKNNKKILELCKYLGYELVSTKDIKTHKLIKNFFKIPSKEFYFLELKH